MGRVRFDFLCCWESKSRNSIGIHRCVFLAARPSYQRRSGFEDRFVGSNTFRLAILPREDSKTLIFKRNLGTMRDSGSLTLNFVRKSRPENPRLHWKYNGPHFDFGFSEYTGIFPPNRLAFL